MDRLTIGSSLRAWALLAFLPLLLSSCTMEKRLYRPGFHVEFFQPQRHTPQLELRMAPCDNPDVSTSMASAPAIPFGDSVASAIHTIEARTPDVQVHSIPLFSHKDTISPEDTGILPHERPASQPVKKQDHTRQTQERTARTFKTIGLTLLIAGLITFAIGGMVFTISIITAAITGVWTNISGFLLYLGLGGMIAGAVCLILGVLSKAPVH